MKKIFYLGAEDSYSYIISKQVILDKNHILISAKNFSEIVESTIKTKNAIGVLPIENSITSDIHENIDYLFKTDLKILYEAFLRIKLHLIGFKQATIKDIKNVYSHERALAQSSIFIKAHQLTIHEQQSTSESKEKVLQEQDKTNGIIGSAEISNHPQLQTLQTDIGNDPYNMTRFVFVGSTNTELVTGIKNKTSIIFTIPHMPGALAQLLTVIAQAHLNVTKIESRPIPGTNWEYQFWIDIENTNGELLKEQIEQIFIKNTLSYKNIGIYPKGEIFES
ncbi:MAG TPA: prephenate dehydratase domain-containing protein [Candidatus Saccharimonadales bacterium]|nr:prephenate dehydratase domain-containing protein [Candidatus Saccharimonadales bacterium]